MAEPAATAMIDRLIYRSEILSLKGDSYRLRGKDLDARLAHPADLPCPPPAVDSLAKLQRRAPGSPR